MSDGLKIIKTGRQWAITDGGRVYEGGFFCYHAALDALAEWRVSLADGSGRVTK